MERVIKSIRTDRPHDEAKRAVYSDIISLMGRAACHTGKEVTWDDLMKSQFLFCDHLDDLDFDSALFLYLQLHVRSRRAMLCSGFSRGRLEEACPFPLLP